MTDPKDRRGDGDPDEGESGKTIGAHKAARTSEMRASVAEAAAQDPRIGQTFGRYKILSLLGRGGMGTVYEGEDARIGRRVAIKFLPPELVKSPLAIKRFVAEAQAAGRLNHPHVVAIYDTAEGETPFIVMELLRRGNAASFIGKMGAMHWAEATRIVADCASALEAAHAVGLIHRDVKPDNILCSPNGVAKLVDFGLAKEAFEESGTTQPGMLLGTPDFMSPEQVKRTPIDHRSDIYSLGATYYALLAGEPPFSKGGPTQIMYAHVHEALPDPRKKAEMPDECVKILERAAAKEPADRYPTAAAMLADLEALLHDAPEIDARFLVADSSTTWAGDSAPPSITPGRAGKPSSRRGSSRSSPGRRGTRLYLLAATVLALMAGAAAGVWWKLKEKKPDPSILTAQQPAVAGPPIRVGILHSMSGTMAFSERPVVDAVLLAIREINEKGGVLGRPIDPVIADGRSDWPTFAREAERLITESKVVTLFGGWTSASRKSMRPVVERLDHLLFYPVQYEGLEDSLNIIYVGAAPNQQVIPATQWCVEKLKRRKLFLVGSDYVFPRAANTIIRDEAKRLGAAVVGEEYLLLGDTDVASIIKKIAAAQPDMILNTINGDSNVAFFKALRAAGFTPDKLPTMSFSIGEGELSEMHGIELVGDYAAWNYFQSVDRKQNREFETRFHKLYGAHRSINDPMEAAYDAIFLWAQAVKSAGTTDVRAVRQAIKGQSFDAPVAMIKIDPSNNHTWKPFRVGLIVKGHKLKVVEDGKELIAPEPFPDSRTRTEWEALLEGLHESWNGNWANPAKPRFGR
jgi:urea transport system substrate-binding protein